VDKREKRRTRQVGEVKGEEEEKDRRRASRLVARLKQSSSAFLDADRSDGSNGEERTASNRQERKNPFRLFFPRSSSTRAKSSTASFICLAKVDPLHVPRTRLLLRRRRCRSALTLLTREDRLPTRGRRRNPRLLPLRLGFLLLLDIGDDGLELVGGEILRERRGLIRFPRRM
jgi:hypothetical protein